MLSRQQPPAVFSRLRLAGRLAFITWDTLRLDPRESEALIRARARRGFTRAQIAELHRITDGWPAGLVLLAADGVESTAGSPAGRVLDREALFDYFASEVLDRADPELRTMLPQLADRFVDGIAALGQKREQDSDLVEATRCYRRGLELEPGAALLQQRLSACSASSSQLGNTAVNEPRR